MEAIFILSIFSLIFVYVLYGPIMLLMKAIWGSKTSPEYLNDDELPSISLIIPAFNEEHWIEEKIKNSLELEYPEDKLEIIVVTDGSSDRTSEVAATFSNSILLLHENERNGKIKAMDRAAQVANHAILVFTDANTNTNTDALLNIGRNFLDSSVGMVSGEKKVLAKKEGEAASGEGMYWKYESWLKKLDSDVASVIGAAGELFAMRASLYKPMPEDTLLDDFMLSARVVELGYRVVYEPKAYAIEYGSVSYKEEWKRKVRICAGGVQSVIRSTALFNVFLYGAKSFVFSIHRASRWTIAPMALLLSYVSSLFLIGSGLMFTLYFLGGTSALIITYWAVETNQKKLPKPLLLIVYFTFMHLSAIAGWFRYFSGKQSINWERSIRMS